VAVDGGELAEVAGELLAGEGEGGSVAGGMAAGTSIQMGTVAV
jgi:hypothetical protein